VLSEYIIKGNAAIIKCNIPSFVTDFAKVEMWLGSDGTEYRYNGTDGEYGNRRLPSQTHAHILPFEFVNFRSISLI